MMYPANSNSVYSTTPHFGSRPLVTSEEAQDLEDAQSAMRSAENATQFEFALSRLFEQFVNRESVSLCYSVKRKGESPELIITLDVSVTTGWQPAGDRISGQMAKILQDAPLAQCGVLGVVISWTSRQASKPALESVVAGVLS